MKRFFIAGNWKMHKTIPESVALARELVPALAGSRHRIMIAPAFTALHAVAEVVSGTNIVLGAQNMGLEKQGAHTGEVSVTMLADIGVKVVILGHSERRHTYGETDAQVNAKARLALESGLEVIICVGETLQERDSGRLEEVVGGQTRLALCGIAAESLARVTLAYEPVWAIGTGKTATPEDADSVHAFIRREIEKLYGASSASSICIQYGGSVKPDNVVALMAKENIDGALVGGASLKAESFVPIAGF